MVIDAHVHFWKYQKTRLGWITNKMKELQKDHLPNHLSPTLSRNGVDGVIAIQAEQAEVETLFLVELAKSDPDILGVVGWVNLAAENVSERLQYFSQFTEIKGYRHILQDEPEEFFYNKAFRRGLTLLKDYNYTYDLLILPTQLNAAIDLVESLSDQIFILDHCAKPDIDKGNIDEWAAGIKALAANRNVYCKLSGLITEAKWNAWSPGDFYPFLDIVFEAFGPKRLLFGSDWPVMLLSGIYVQWKSLLEKYMEDFIMEDRQAVFGDNAARVYDGQGEIGFF